MSDTSFEPSAAYDSRLLSIPLTNGSRGSRTSCKLRARLSHSETTRLTEHFACRCPTIVLQQFKDLAHRKCRLPSLPDALISIFGWFAESFPVDGGHPFESPVGRISTVTPSPRPELLLILYFPEIKSLATSSRVLPKLSMAEILSSVACKCSSNPGSLQI